MSKRIPEPQKLLILADAIATSAPDAAKRWGVSDAVVYSWADALGGLRALRELYEIRQMGAVSNMAAEISHELRRRLPKLGPKGLIALALQVIEHGQAGVGKGSALNINLSQQQLQAQKQAEDDDPNRVAAILGVLAEAGLLSAPGPNGAEAEVLPAPADTEAGGVPDTTE